MNSRRLRIGAATAISVVAASLAATTAPAAHAADCFTSAPTPTLTGAVREGDTLTAHRGDWAPAPDSSVFTWYVGGDPVPGSEEGTFYRGGTYVPDADDVGKTIKVRVTATLDGCEDFRDSALTVPVHERSYNEGLYPNPPVPTFTGEVTVGAVVTAHAGAWPADASLEYRWYVVEDGDVLVPLSGLAESPRFRLPGDAYNRTIAVRVRGVTGYYRPTLSPPSAYSATPVAIGTLTTSRPTITGTRKVGRKLTAHPGTWTAGTAFSYRWYANGHAIKGATSRTFTPKAGHAGRRLTVKVTGRQTGYRAASRTSLATRPIAR